MRRPGDPGVTSAEVQQFQNQQLWNQLISQPGAVPGAGAGVGIADILNQLFQTPTTDPGGTAVLEEYQRLPGLYSAAWQDMADPIISGFGERHARALKDLEGLGEQQRADINRAYDRQAANVRSDLTARGLGTSTAVQNALRANEAQRRQDMRRLEDQLTRERLEYDTGLSKEMLDVMRSLGVGGFEAGVRQPTEMFARAKERLVTQGAMSQADQDAATIDFLMRLGQLGLNTDIALTDPAIALSQGAQFQGGVSPASQISQFLTSQFFAPQPEAAEPDYLMAALSGLTPGLSFSF